MIKRLQYSLMCLIAIPFAIAFIMLMLILLSIMIVLTPILVFIDPDIINKIKDKSNE